MYIVKLLVYTLLITISGYALIDSLIRPAVSQQRQGSVNKLMQQASKLLVFAVVAALFVQIISWVQQFKPEADQLIALLLEGWVGRVWLVLLLLSILFSLLAHKSPTARLLLVFAMLLAESMNGHASGDSILILFDFVHLAAVSIWIGGAICLWWNWREDKELALAFIQKFTKLLWLTIAVVSVSGLVMMLLISPSLTYLLYTGWGQLLLIKIAAVLLALWLGYKAKSFIQKHEQAKQAAGQGSARLRPLATELIVLMLVIAFAGGVSSLSPSPSAANALNYHQMGEELHYTVKLTPNAPGPNRLSLSLWTLEEEGEIEQVQLSLQATDKQKAVAREFQLEIAELEDFFEFPGFIETRYTLPELKLPYPSSWQATFTVSFMGGTERQFSFEFKN